LSGSATRVSTFEENSVRKILTKLVWADDFTKDLFETNQLEGRHLTDYICSYSLFKLYELYGSNFFDPNSGVIFDYTIQVNYRKQASKLSTYLYNELDVFSEAFDTYKTLFSEVTTIVYKDSQSCKNMNCSLILKTKLAPIRENFDQYIYKDIYDI
jgi:hypothetical protein